MAETRNMRITEEEIKKSGQVKSMGVLGRRRCVSIVRAHAITQRDYAVLRSMFSCWCVLKQLIRILCTYPGLTVLEATVFLF
jgi:hypothetical protein